MMNGTLPGLLDDPHITSSLPSLNDVHIPPLRNPAPSRNGHAPLPLELIDSNYLSEQDRHGRPIFSDEDYRARYTQSVPLEPAANREAKKPHLAISELVDAPAECENGQVQLPSFVSLSVVEKSPQQKQLDLNNGYPRKRLRLDPDSESTLHDMHRLLPRPIQKDDKHVRPLLPAMVTGLHEPPPSAALLPSIDLESRPAMHRSSTSKMQVKDILSETQRSSATDNRPPEQMLNTPEVAAAELPKAIDVEALITDVDTSSTTASITPTLQLPPKKDPKVRRVRRKWSEAETQDLLAGVKKHGFGKWKQILNDSTYTFAGRTSIDLKDRFRVFAKEYLDLPAAGPTNRSASNTSPEAESQPESTGAASEYRASHPGAAVPQNKQRRKRHPWTTEEDQALLQGVTKYGFQWTDIHNDAELGLGHRRATDLRDRIRNLYPDGYKHAEARPLRSETKKAEKAGKKETPAGTLYAPSSQMDNMSFPSESRPSVSIPSKPAARTLTRRQTTSGKVPSIASLTSATEDNDATVSSKPNALRRSKTIAEQPTNASDQAGITLPSLALDNADSDDDWDNTLPPFMNWDQEMGV